MTTSADSPLRWITAGEQRHVLLERRHDFERKPYVLTGCGRLIWPSRHDARIPDPRVCVPCAVLYDNRDD